MLCEVESSFINDESNLHGLKSWEANEYNFDIEEKEQEMSIDAEKFIFNNALSIIENQSELEDLELNIEIKQKIKTKTQHLYCVLHQRFI